MKAEGNKKPKVRCYSCCRVVAGYVPKGGDGSLWFAQKHKDGEGKWCEGRWDEAHLLTPDRDALPTPPKTGRE